MAKEIDVSIDTQGGVVVKRALNEAGAMRLAWESAALFALQESPHTPNLLGYHDAGFGELTMSYVDGVPLPKVIGMDSSWLCRPMAWKEFRPYFQQYVAVETDLLARGALYRDLNLNHLIFESGGNAVLVDHETTLFKTDEMTAWSYHNQRGTWETMAPEEFSGRGELTERIATYRAGVLAHLALTGGLPFPRYPLRMAVAEWRRRHAPRVDSSLPRDVRMTLRTALDVQPGRRQPDPITLYEEIESFASFSG